jgi:hypothetical protein
MFSAEVLKQTAGCDPSPLCERPQRSMLLSRNEASDKGLVDVIFRLLLRAERDIQVAPKRSVGTAESLADVPRRRARCGREVFKISAI